MKVGGCAHQVALEEERRGGGGLARRRSSSQRWQGTGSRNPFVLHGRAGAAWVKRWSATLAPQRAPCVCVCLCWTVTSPISLHTELMHSDVGLLNIGWKFAPLLQIAKSDPEMEKGTSRWSFSLTQLGLALPTLLSTHTRALLSLNGPS